MLPAACLRSVLLILFAASLALPQAFTIDQVLSAPFPSNLAASPAGEKIAWVFEIRGLRNIWVAEGPDFKARQLTSYTQDDGQEIGDLSWSGDGSAIAYTRGGDANSRGEIPNPDQPSGRRATSRLSGSLLGRRPAPDRSRLSALASRRRKTLSTSTTARSGRQASNCFTPAAQPKTSAGRPTAHASLSPACAAIIPSSASITSQRKNFVYRPQVDRDGNSAWSPDGRTCVSPHSRGTSSFTPCAAANGYRPWSIRVVDLKTGSGREIWRANEAHRQRRPRYGCGQPVVLGRGRSHRVCLGRRRLAASLFR